MALSASGTRNEAASGRSNVAERKMYSLAQNIIRLFF